MKLRLDEFELKMTWQLGSSETLDITKVKSKVAEINRMMDELYARLVVSEPKVMIVIPEVHVYNIWAISNSVKEPKD